MKPGIDIMPLLKLSKATPGAAASPRIKSAFARKKSVHAKPALKKVRYAFKAQQKALINHIHGFILPDYFI